MNVAPATFPNTRRNRPIIARTPQQFARGLGSVGWFANIGMPSPWDHSCARIYAWWDWPGPEDPLNEAFSQLIMNLRNRVLTPDLQALFDRVHMLVMSYARTEVPYDPDEDAWHAPTQCVWEAAEVAGLVTCALTRGGPVPEDLIELWNWFAAGHWPSSFAREEDDRPADKFLVYPRGLLVY